MTVDFGSEALRTKGGQSVDLRPQAFAVLRYLAEHSDRLVSKNELMQAIWPDIAVTDDSLIQCIHEIRRALQDGKQTVLKTKRKRGYRLLLPAEATLGVSQSLERGEEVPFGSVPPQIAATRQAKVSIAVLPFVNMSSDPEQEYFSDGITEDIITDLSRWQSLAVASRHATSRFKGHPLDIQAVGRALGAHFVVEGSVRRMDERIRITAQLIDPETGNHIWAERFDRPMADLFTVQDEVVRTVVGTLVGRVYASAAENLRRKPPSSPAAYDLTMRGNWLPWDKLDARAEARRCLEQAIQLDPDYGLPHSLLGLMLRFDWHRGLSGSRDVLDRALALARRGVELAGNDSSAHGTLAQVYLERRSFDLAVRHVEHALEINPANPWHHFGYGVLLTHIGRAEEGLGRLRRARHMDPYFGPPAYWPAVGFAHFVLRRYADALADFDRGAPTAAISLAAMAGCCAKLGLSDRAGELVAGCRAVQPEAAVSTLVTRIVFKDAGDSEHLVECLRLADMPEQPAAQCPRGAKGGLRPTSVVPTAELRPLTSESGFPTSGSR